MDIDDEFQLFMRLSHPGLPQDCDQWHVQRNTFFAGMMAMFPIFDLQPKTRAVGALLDVKRQLATHVQRADAGMEPGFSNTDFRD